MVTITVGVAAYLAGMVTTFIWLVVLVERDRRRQEEQG